MRIPLTAIKRELDKLEAKGTSDNKRKRLDKAIEALKIKFDKVSEEYNSQEAKAIRDKKYKELRRIAKLRRDAKNKGLDPDVIAPLTWETEEALENEIKETESWIECFKRANVEVKGLEAVRDDRKKKLETLRAKKEAFNNKQ